MERLVEKFLLVCSVEAKLSKKTVEIYQQDLMRFCKHAKEKEIALSEVRKQDIAQYLSVLVDNGLSMRSTGRHRASLRQFFKFLYFERILSNNPCSSLDPIKYNVKLPNALNEDQVNLFLDAANNNGETGLRDASIFELLYSSGIRVSELTNLKMDGLFLDDGYIKVLGKGDKERIAPISKKAMALLRFYLKESRPKLIFGKTVPWVFVSCNGKKLSRSIVWWLCKKYAAISGLDVQVNPHKFRHSFATHLLKSGADLISVQQLLGHASVTSTQIYTHIQPQQLKSAHEKFHPRR